MKRLIKSELFTGFKYRDISFEMYKNPISNEVLNVKKTNVYGGIRGMIEENGTLYIWSSEIVHDIALMLINNSIEDYLRFSYNDSDGWFFNAKYRFNSNEIDKLIIKNKNTLSQIGNIENNFSYSYTKDKNNKTFKIEDMEKVSKLIKSEINLKSPIELLNFMKNIDYGFIGIDNKKYNNLDNDSYRKYKLKNPIDMFKNKIGVCWDQTQFEKYIFNKMNYKFKTYYIQLNDKTNSTHTFLVYEENNKYYYFENAYEKIKGIWESNSIDDIFNFILKNLFEDDKQYDFEIYEYNTEKSGFKTLEFMNYIIDNGVKISHNYYSDKIHLKKVI